MWCIHHIDDDGYCAAAIVRNELQIIFDPIRDDHFIPYNHGKKLILPKEDDIEEGEVLYIVDIALNEDIISAIRLFDSKNCKIVHIDHHKSGANFAKNLSDSDKEIYERCVVFHNTEFSATMLTWIYACMDSEERKNPSGVNWQVAEDDLSMIGFNIGEPTSRTINVPHVVRYVDDYDMWRFKLGDETRLFHTGFNLVTNKKPYEKLWQQILYAPNSRACGEYINRAIPIRESNAIISERTIKRAFEVELAGIKALALNFPPIYGSEVFGEKYNQYDMVILFEYDGDIKKWRYHFYAHEGSPVDCADIATRFFNGGGHKGAAGGILDSPMY